MNLDQAAAFTQIDRSDMLTAIHGLPKQLDDAWQLGQTLDLPPRRGIRRVLIAGMGGSAIAADLLAAWAAPSCRVPIIVHRDYGLPAWTDNYDTLVIISSHSGNTEETLDVFEAGLLQECRLMVITTGGRLADRADERGMLKWQFAHAGQPRSAVGLSFGLLLSALARLELIEDPSGEIASATAEMVSHQASLSPQEPACTNPAKRLAGQLIGRWVNVIGSGLLAPVARRWKTQINELAKAGAGFESLPEADHNSLAGIFNPESTLNHTSTIFLKHDYDQPRNRLRSQLTQQTYMLEGLNTNDFTASGQSRLAQQWSCLHFGDYLAYYLAMAYGVDPTPVQAIQDFKSNLG